MTRKELRIFNPLYLAVSLLLILLNGYQSYGQNQVKKSQNHLRDSLRHAVLKRDSLLRSYKQSDASLNMLFQKVEDYTSTYNQLNGDMNKGFDTLVISQELPVAERRMKTMQSLINDDRSCTLGYLFTIRDMMAHIGDDLETWQAKLTDYNGQLNKALKEVAEITADSALHIVPADSVLRIKYINQVNQLQLKYQKIDAVAKKTLVKIGFMQNRVATLDILLIDLNDQVDFKIQNFSNKVFENEYGFIWQMHQQKSGGNFASVTDKTINLNYKLLRYFIDPKTTNHTNLLSHLAIWVVLFAFYGWVYTTRLKLAKTHLNPDFLLAQTKYTNKHSFFSAGTIAGILALYFYDQPPYIFLEMMLLFMMASIGVLIKVVWPKPFFKLWGAVFALTFLYALSNLYTQVTYVDRVFNLFLGAISIVISILFLQASKPEPQAYPPFTRPVIRLFIILQAVAMLLNILGRFNLAKLISVASIFNLCLGFGFYLFIQIVMESLYLQLEANKKTDDNDSVIHPDFKELQKKFKNVLIKVAVLLWLIKLAENLDIDDYIYGIIGDFLNHPYKFSNTAFTFGSIAIFVLVIWLSGIVSRVISYFYDFAGQQTKLTPKAKKTRSSILLIRLTIFTIGFLIAIAASGIPMDRLTIIISAFGVGIGFGLQNIVNNLVSGIILAIEKPVQVGDIIEVDKYSGVIKEIGMRSSKIDSGDGSEIIIPNGDLISNRVTNWTLSNIHKRIELIIKVAYGSDISQVEEILQNVINSQDDVMKTPGPSVFVHNFSESSIDFMMWFWVADLSTSLGLRSKVMNQVYTEFNNAGIHMPFPQRNVRVYFPEDDSLAGKIKEQPSKAENEKVPENLDMSKENPSGQAQ